MNKSIIFLFAVLYNPLYSQVDYKNEIEPIFYSYCSGCHTGGGSSGGQDLSSYAALMRGGNSGPTILPGDYQSSLLWRRINDGSMPPSSNDVPLSKVELIGKWINEGALQSAVAQNQPPEDFTWLSSERDTIFISSDNSELRYSLKWEESKDADGDQVTYILFAGTNGSKKEEVYKTQSVSHLIPYDDFLQKTFEQIPTATVASVAFSMIATDGKDTTEITGNDRTVIVDRSDYLSIDKRQIPSSYVLYSNYPNPFNPQTQIQFDTPVNTSIKISIYNMLGQTIKTFNFDNTSAGTHRFSWDSTDNFGNKVPAGVYLYQMETVDFIETKKMVLLK